MLFSFKLFLFFNSEKVIAIIASLPAQNSLLFKHTRLAKVIMVFFNTIKRLSEDLLKVSIFFYFYFNIKYIHI